MKAAKHILTLMFALLMIISSTGLTLAAHICQGELRELAFTGQEQNCCAINKQPPHCADHSTDKEEMPSDCCDYIKISAETPEAIIKNVNLESLQSDQFIVQFTAAYLVALLLPDTEAENTNYAHYPPPLTVQDIPVLVQSFLL